MQKITNSAWVGEKFDVYAHFDVNKYINKITSKAGSRLSTILKSIIEHNLREICSNPDVRDIEIQKELRGYPKDWYECRILSQRYGPNIRLVYKKSASKNPPGYTLVNLVGIYKHTDVKARKPLSKKSALVEDNFEPDDDTSTIGEWFNL